MTDLQSRVQQSLAGSYTLERELGGGGMSKVFVAHEHSLGRTVVVKLLSPELAAAMSATRFEREIRVAASLQQANIVPVLTTGTAEEMPGSTFAQAEAAGRPALLARGTPVIGEVVRILPGVSCPLHIAREDGGLNPARKPDRVFLCGHRPVATTCGCAK